MIPQIIVKSVDPAPNLWNKKQPKLFEDFLSKVNHLKNEVKEMEHKLKNREDTYKILENKILSSLGISNIIKTTNVLEFLDGFNEKSQNYEIQLLENQVQSLEKEIGEVQALRKEKIIEIDEKSAKLTEFKKLKEEMDSQSNLKLSLKKSIKEIQGEIVQLNYILLERKKLLGPQDVNDKIVLNDDLVMLIENFLKAISKIEGKISTRRSSLDFIASNFEKMESLEKDLETARKNQKKTIREYEEKINNDNDSALDNYKAKIKSDLNNLEENNQKQLNSFEQEITNLDTENQDLNKKLEELERISKEVNKKEKDLNAIKIKWDELWNVKSEFEKDLFEQEEKLNYIRSQNKKKPRKSFLR